MKFPKITYQDIIGIALFLILGSLTIKQAHADTLRDHLDRSGTDTSASHVDTEML